MWVNILTIALTSTAFPSISSTSAFQLPMETPFSSSKPYIHSKHSTLHQPSPSKIVLAMTVGKESDPVPLAKEGKWQAFLDEDTTGLIYYFNVDTGVSMWEPPTVTFPKIRMTRREKKRMMAIREDFAAKEKKEKEKKNKEAKAKRESLFSWLTGGDEDDAKTVATDKKVDVVNGAEIEAVPAQSPIVSAAANPKPKEEKKVEQAAPSLSIPFFAAFKNREDITATPKTDNAPTNPPANKKSDSPPPAKEKIQVTTKSTIKIEIGTKVLPHPEKISWGGEDAIFSQGRTFGVFDGVSGAEKEEGLPLYSLTLAKEMKANAGPNGLSVKDLQKQLLSAAELADKGATGASTALVASVGDDGFLRAVNLGDSFLMVVRDGEVVARSEDIVHYFDCPYQLAEECPDRPIDGTTMNVEVKPGDTIVLGSDGVFDNLTEDAVCDIIKEGSGPNVLANIISLESRRVGDDSTAETPYAKEAKKNKYEEYSNGLGGKVDDVSCVVVKCS